MKKVLYLLLFLTCSAYGQEIPIGTIFTIEFNNPDNKAEFSIVSKQPYEGVIDISKIDADFKTKPEKKQIVGLFAKGIFAGKLSPMLVLLSGLDGPLEYTLEVKTPQSNNFQNTSTIALFKGVKSIEHWPYNIEKINFKLFKSMLMKN